MADASPEATPRLRVSDFDYPLPPGAIAQVPAEPRDAARLLVLDRARSRPGRPHLRHRVFRELGDELRAGDLLVTNDSKVIAARLAARRTTGGAAEVLVLRPMRDETGRWEALVRPSRRIADGDRLTLRTGDALEVGERLGDGTRAVRFFRDPAAVIASAGEMPLPPYIRSRSSPSDRYQTVYARPPGSAAAPTAGLHFTPELLSALERDGVRRVAVTLHVGLDTFRPLEGQFIEEHAIHREWYDVPLATRRLVLATRRDGGRVVAVGTTTVRTLETLAQGGGASGWSELYITPPFGFSAIDALITNFHLPRSSLLLLVTAWVQAGMRRASVYEARDTLLEAYRVALDEGYRFFSFGDAMLIV